MFSVNLTNQKNPANLNYHMQLRKVKRSCNALQISSLVFGLHWAQKTKPCFVTLRIFFSFLFPPSSFLFRRSSFLFPPSSFLFPLSSFRFPLSFFLFPLSSFLFPLSSFLLPPSYFLFPLSSFLFLDLSRKDRSDSVSRVDCRSFSVLTILTGSRPEESSKCHKTWFRFLSTA